MKETFILRTDWADSIFELTNEGQATILRNLFRYHIDPNDELELDTQEVRIVWKLIRKNLDLNIENYEKRREINKANGSKGGRPKANESENNPIGYSGITEKANVTLSVFDTDTVTDIVTDTVIKKEESDFLQNRPALKKLIEFDSEGNQIDSSQTIEDQKEKIASKRKSPEPVELSEESSRFVDWWIKDFLPDHIKATDKMKTDWRKVWDRLRKDHQKEVLQEVIKFTMADKFEAKNMQTPMKLTRTNPDGVKYIDKFITQWQLKHRVATKVDDTDWDAKAEEIRNQQHINQ